MGKRVQRFFLSLLLLTVISGCSPEMSLKQETIEFYVGQEFIAEEFISEDLKDNVDIEITNNIVPTSPGEYEVVYKLGSSESILIVTVKEDPITLLKNSIIIEKGMVFSPLDLISNEDKGNRIQIDNSADVETPGNYKVNYSFEGITKSIDLKVEELQFSLLKDSVAVSLGSSFNPKDYFTTNFPESKNITISDNVDTNTLGNYKVNYQVGTQLYNLAVTVKDVSPILTEKTEILSYASKFNPLDYLVKEDKSNPDIVISNPVDTNVAGTYIVTYTLGKVVKNLTVTVKEKVVEVIQPIKVLSLTSSIDPGQNATISIKGTPNKSYSITVYYKSGASKADGLYSKTSDSTGYVEWTWEVGTRTSAGSWRIEISSSVDSITTYIKVN